MKVVAVNTSSWSSLDEWVAFWKSRGAGDVIWASDRGLEAARAFTVTSLGTTIIIDRQGRVSYRDGGATPYETLRARIEDAL